MRYCTYLWVKCFQRCTKEFPNIWDCSQKIISCLTTILALRNPLSSNGRDDSVVKQDFHHFLTKKWFLDCTVIDGPSYGSQCRHRSDDWLSPIQHRSLQLNTWEESFWLILKFQFLTKIHQITSLLASMISISRQEYRKPNLSTAKIMLDKLLLAIRY